MSYKAEQVKILTIYIISSCFIFRADNIYHHLHDYLNSMFFFLFDAVLSNKYQTVLYHNRNHITIES